VRFNGASANVKLPGNFPCGSSVGHKLRHLAFSLCQRLQLVVQRAELGRGYRDPGCPPTAIVLLPNGHREQSQNQNDKHQACSSRKD
jgi:hypothetical protein